MRYKGTFHVCLSNPCILHVIWAENKSVLDCDLLIHLGKNGRKVYTHILAHVQLIGCFVFFWKVCLAHFRAGKSNLDQLLTIDYDRKRQYALAKRK